MPRGAFTPERIGVIAVVAALLVAASQAFVQGIVERAQLLTLGQVDRPLPSELDLLIAGSGLLMVISAALLFGLVAEAVGELPRLFSSVALLILVGAGTTLALLAAPTIRDTLGAGLVALLLLVVATLAFLGVALLVAALFPTSRPWLIAAWNQLRRSPLAGPPAPPIPPLALTQADAAVLALMLEYVRRLFDREGDRTSTIERKATTLISALGIASAFTVSAAAFLLGSSGDKIMGTARVLVLLLYFSTVAFLAGALFLGLRATRVVYWSSPDPTNVIDMDTMNPAKASQTEIAALYKALLYNQDRNNELAVYVNWAQKIAVAAAISLLVLALTLAKVASG